MLISYFEAMRWNKVGVISILVLSLLLASCAPEPGPTQGAWDTILEIGSLGFLCDSTWFGLGPCDYEHDLVALMRVLLGILVFALLYMGTASVPGLKENRNISITVSIILAVIAVIFIPPSILRGIGSAYGTLVAVILLGAPILGIFLLYRTLDDQSVGVKIGLLVVLLLILSAIKNFSGGLIDDNVPLQGLAGAILGLVDWGIGIVIFVGIWELWKAFRGAGGTSAVSRFGTGFGKGVQKYLNPWSKRFARRVQKGELNEYIMEKLEEKELDQLKGEALHIVSDLELWANRRYLTNAEKNGVVEAINKFGELLNKTIRDFRSLSKRTSRADNSLDKMFNYFKEKGIKVPEEVKALENNIMKLHQQTAQEIAGVEGLYQKIMDSEAMKKLKSMTAEMFGGAPYQLSTSSEPFSLVHLHALIKGFQDERFLLEDAYKKQAEAEKELLGIIQQTRGLYE